MGACHEITAQYVPRRVRVPARDEARRSPHPDGRRVEHAAGVAHPCAAEVGPPCGEEVRRLASRRVAVDEQMLRVDVIGLPDFGKCRQKRPARPRLRLPVAVVVETGRNEEYPVPVGPRKPAELA